MKKVLTVVLIGVLLCCTVMGLYVFEPAPLRKISLTAYDLLLRQHHRPAQGDRVVVVDIDEESLRYHGQWPWPRYLLADLVDRLFDAGARIVAFDILFAEPDGKSPRAVLDGLNRHFGAAAKVEGLPQRALDFDEIFAVGLDRRNTVVGCFMSGARLASNDSRPPTDPDYQSRILPIHAPGSDPGPLAHYIPNAVEVNHTIPVLRRAAMSTAFINAATDYDNVVRSQPLVWACGPEYLYPSLALEVIRLDQGADQVVVHYDAHGLRRVRVKELTIPTDRIGRAIINYRSAAEDGHAFPFVSARGVLSGEVSPAAVSNKIVLVGTSAPGLLDIRATPLRKDAIGVETQAALIDNILTGDTLRHPLWMRALDVLLTLTVGILLSIVIARTGPAVSFLVTALVVLLGINLSALLLRYAGLVFVPARLILSSVVVYLALTTVQYWRAESKRRWLRRMIGPMVSEQVLTFMEQHPDCLSPQGQEVNATVFFSDITGFTALVEKLRAERVSEFMNAYLSTMNQLIIDRKGYVDKYEGDAIMAVWGVPFPLASHAAEACLSALDQQEALLRLRAQFQKTFGFSVAVRMGINSGTVKAGNMGSDRRFQYTVMGDTVNLAARLEPLNKTYRTAAILGEGTQLQVRDAVETRMLDRVIVAGKTVPTSIFELVGKKGSLTKETVRLVRLYEDALHLHWEKKWERALACLEQVLQVFPKDGPSLLLQARIAAYLEHPPPDTWDGAFVFTEKSPHHADFVTAGGPAGRGHSPALV